MQGLSGLLMLVLGLTVPGNAFAFCGFYVGKAEAKLYNHASQVVLVHHDGKTVVSLMNDYQGPLSEFALVVPVPVVLQPGQVHIGDRELFRRIEEYSAPRLVEYFDPNPCAMPQYGMGMTPRAASALESAAPAMSQQATSLGVTVEAQYSVGEYDIVILSAEQSDGLETWLRQNGYHVPPGASAALKPYVRQKMKFFVAKVNLKQQARTGLAYLRPIQFAFDSAEFMLPIRLGMINADGPQDLLIYVLTMNGRVETTTYRTVMLPTGVNLPEYVRGDFQDFYRSMFDQQVKRNHMSTVFTEYVWNMGWCDPCAAPPLSREELRHLGVFWLDEPRPMGGLPRSPMIIGGPVPVILTRLHVRYSADTFPEDLVFQETGDRANFQARYVIRHAWNGSPDVCPAAKAYFRDLERRWETEAETLSDLTGWNIDEILRKAGLPSTVRPEPWWQGIWNQ